MAYHLALSDHFSSDELHRRYRACTDPVERSRWHIVWLKSCHRATPQIAEATGYAPGWVRTIIHRYNDGGAEALKDRRHAHPGALPLLTPEQEAALEAAIDSGEAPDSGPWSGPKVARWIEQATGREQVHDQRGWEYLVRLGFTAQTPRPRHEQADPAAQAAFKKGPRRRSR